MALVPGSFTGIVGDTVRLVAIACGSRSCQYSYASESFAWSSSDAAVVMVARGLVHAVGRGTGYVKATISGKSDSAQIRVGSSYVPLARLSPGGQCALTGSGAAYCWIDTLPPYTFTDFQMFFMSMPYAFAPGVTFTSIASGGGGGCGIAADGQGYCPGVIGGLRFRSLSAGRRDAWSSGPDHWCGVAVDGGAWCWGADDRGQLGVDSTFPTCHWGWGYNVSMQRYTGASRWRPVLYEYERRWQSQLRSDRGRDGLLLGRQRLGTTGRQLDGVEGQPCPGARRPTPSVVNSGFRSHLWPRERRGGVLLGPQ